MPSTSITVTGLFATNDSTPGKSEAIKADGYYGNSDGLHTVAYIVSSDYVGTIKMQGSLATNPEDQDWFDISGTSVGNGVDVVPTQYINFTGNFVWVRSIVTADTGSLTKILLNF